MARKTPTIATNPAPKLAKPAKAQSPFVSAPPRIKPAQMRNYGKSLSVYSGNPDDPSKYGAGTGYGGT